MKQGDIIQLIELAVNPNPMAYDVLRLPKIGDILTCREIITDSQGKKGVYIEEYIFGYFRPNNKEIAIAVSKWRVIEPMDITEVIKEVHSIDYKDIYIEASKLVNN